MNPIEIRNSLLRRVAVIADPFYRAICANSKLYDVGGIDVHFDWSRVSLDPTSLFNFDHDLHSEKEVIEEFITEIRPDDVVFDVGANVGLYTLPALSKLTDGHIHAFEPHPIIAAQLRRNIVLNPGMVTVHNYALGGESAEFTISEYELSDVDDGYYTQMKRGDDLVSESPIDQPTIVKIDVEGHEIGVLEGMEKMLANCRVIFCEAHPQFLREFGYTVEDVRERLRSAGFKTKTLQRRENERHIKATRLNTTR